MGLQRRQQHVLLRKSRAESINDASRQLLVVSKRKVRPPRILTDRACGKLQLYKKTARRSSWKLLWPLKMHTNHRDVIRMQHASALTMYTHAVCVYFSACSSRA